MKTNLICALLFIALGCSENKNFENIPCSPSDRSENDNLKQIFKPCRKYIYQAKYWDENYNLISDENISMMATGIDWEHQPESQDQIVIQYGFNKDLIDKIDKYNINSQLKQSWKHKTTTGIIENGNTTWMHPFRQNQYIFTEIAPFPSVNFPLETGKTWESNLNIYEGWGDWSDTEIKNQYEVIGKDSVQLSIGSLEAWHVSSIGYAQFGNSYHDFWYNNNYGFVKMIIKNYKNQLLKFELIEVIE
ncbi:hypothetical protein SAMN04488029_0441 [Reichenbachiella faecimaris]|uniref:Uncharacterized protein n=1 Tax=Reichenbachiella faecimaris TaxID=692418 RepID=A0A1W2G684_REIFA|nr:hypothetical protein [Reichenbachiella faecimaris]SMD32101.1 hypothetical protein SAMN04488029_0441 [Reichenbachiella faecimaris]